MDRDYVMKENISHREARDLLDFLKNRLDSKCLHKMVQEKALLIPIVYRGLKYRKQDLYEGHEYEHRYLLSSWSLSREVAMSFALDGYVPEKMLEEISQEKGYSITTLYKDHEVWEVCEKEFVNVLLVCENVSGFSVNQHIHHPYFSKESEVILYGGKWIFNSISYKQTENGFPYVEVQAVWMQEDMTKAS